MSKARELAELGAAYDSGALSNRNLIINGAMQVTQRGTDAKTGHATDLYGTDRFRAIENHTGSMSSQQVADAPVGFYYSNKITVTGTDSSLGSTEYGRQLTSIEGLNMAHLNWGTANAKTVTLSFYVKSSLTGAFYINVFNSAANRSFVAGYTIDAANTWERKSIKITGDTSGTWLTTNGGGAYIAWSLGAGSTYQTSTLNSWAGAFDMAGSDQVNIFATNSATWQLTGVQMELGTEATPFEHRSFGDELLRCQRYYQTLTVASTYREISTTEYADFFSFNTTMRASPTAAVETQFKYWSGGTPTNVTPTFDTKTNGSNITMSLLTTGRGFNAGEASFDSEL